MLKYTIIKTQENEFQFHLKLISGHTILKSKIYKTREDCTNGITLMRNMAAFDTQYTRQLLADGRYYFQLINGNAEVIGTSEIFIDIFNRENGINLIKQYALNATID